MDNSISLMEVGRFDSDSRYGTVLIKLNDIPGALTGKLLDCN